jgi:radical SAM protein with 4Fe4S-binding SPASM domain
MVSYRILIKKSFQKLIPLSCVFELTYRCNLSCVHCYIVRRKKRELETDVILKILKELKNQGCLFLTFSGGEIFLRRDFFKIARYAKKLNFAIRLFTNGTLIDRKIADKIKNLKPLSVEISCYGFKETHEKITRQKKSFSKTIKAVKLLKNRGIKVFVKSVLLKQNVHEIWELKNFVIKKLKAEWRGIGGGLLIAPCDNGSRRPLKYRISDDRLRVYIRQELEASITAGMKYNLDHSHMKEKLCGAGFSNCNVTPYGELNPCVQIRIKQNDLKNIGFSKIWHENEQLNKLRNLCLSDRKDCLGCEFADYCFVCPGIALIEAGSLVSKLPESCRLAIIRKKVYSEVNRGKA